MPGSGVTAENIITIAESTGATELHSSATFPEESKMEYKNIELNETLNHVTVNKETVRTMADLLKSYSLKLKK
jgi:copper homeostasis protein CutC